MSISSAMQTGVSGLLANSTAVGNISDNIANANTDGFRRSFSQMVTNTSSGSSPEGVRAQETTDVQTAGALRATNSTTDMAIAGDGFFVVTQNVDETVETNYYLTRAGSFVPDEDGNLVNAAGYYLAGYQYLDDGTLGPVSTSSFTDLTTVNVNDVAMSGSPTTSISVAGNLPSQETGITEPGDPFVSSTEFYSPLGAAERVIFSWQPNTRANEWTLTVSDEGGTDYGTVDVTFNDSGTNPGSPASYTNVTSLVSSPAGFAVDSTTGIITLTVDNGTTPQIIEIDLGAPDTFDGITQFAGDFTPQEFDTNGSEAGTLVRVEIDDNGDLYGVFDNGARQTLYQIPVGVVTNPNGLIAEDGNAYSLSKSAGQFSLTEAGTNSSGTISAGMLESSNVEIAQELTDLIRIQRAYSSNATIITTADEMLEETTRLKR